jgi:hypothetical protein
MCEGQLLTFILSTKAGCVRAFTTYFSVVDYLRWLYESFDKFGLKTNAKDMKEVNNSNVQKELQKPLAWLFCISLFFIFSYSEAYENFDITSLWKLAKLSLITVLQVFCMTTAMSGAAFRLLIDLLLSMNEEDSLVWCSMP